MDKCFIFQAYSSSKPLISVAFTEWAGLEETHLRNIAKLQNIKNIIFNV